MAYYLVTVAELHDTDKYVSESHSLMLVEALNIIKRDKLIEEALSKWFVDSYKVAGEAFSYTNGFVSVRAVSIDTLPDYHFTVLKQYISTKML
jgi:hypothetical protein